MAPSHSLALCFCGLLFLAGLADARQHYRSRIPNGDIVRCPTGDPNCGEGDLCEGIGHESCAGGAVTPRLNPFGQDLSDAGVKWTKELCEKDSDGDGFSNGHELGDPCCIWREGASSPQWMLDWPVSHPGVPHSKQLPDQDLEELCRSAEPLEPVKFYNEGEDQLTLEYPMLPQTVPPQETTYVDYRLNLDLPDDDKVYYVVGAEALLDNEEMVHHFTVASCSERVEKPGVIPNDTMNVECLESIFIWAPGTEPYALPLNAAIPIGKGTGRVGLHLQMHYDNPLFKEGHTDASGMKLHVTTSPREFEAGVLLTGTQMDVGRIPPKTKFYSSTVFQIEVDQELAPDGVTVFAFFPHMHLTGRRIFTEKLKGKPDQRKPATSLDLGDLEKDGDVARDDSWSFIGQKYFKIDPVKLYDGDYVATTCLYNTKNRDEVTVGGLGSREEMCFNILAFYPEKAIKYKFLKGPSYVGELDDDQYVSTSSITDILQLPQLDTSFPAWRRAYFDGELVCDESGIEGGGLEINNEAVADTVKDLGEACGEKLSMVLMTNLNDKEDLECSKECAKVVYNRMGCYLMKRAIKDGEIKYPLEAVPMEHTAERHCGKVPSHS
ncbi:hypothetical protein BSKO_09087 [Bryopsis sp. KO-2023]|nr:hypothetical protein BSKO_09087 [Bryopsis sp. KO-2023]